MIFSILFRNSIQWYTEIKRKRMRYLVQMLQVWHMHASRKRIYSHRNTNMKYGELEKGAQDFRNKQKIKIQYTFILLYSISIFEE